LTEATFVWERGVSGDPPGATLPGSPVVSWSRNGLWGKGPNIVLTP
jgi:hypothetical protein